MISRSQWAKLPDNRVKHIPWCVFVCSFIYHWIPIYAVHTLSIHILFQYYDTAHAMRYILPYQKRNMLTFFPVVVYLKFIDTWKESHERKLERSMAGVNIRIPAFMINVPMCSLHWYKKLKPSANYVQVIKSTAMRRKKSEFVQTCCDVNY